MISAHFRSAGSCDRCVWAMVLCELAELALHIRRLPATATTQPMRRQRLFCLTWIALISCTLPGGERGSSANGKDPRCRHSSEIDFAAVLIQQQYVIGFSLKNLATKRFRGRGNFQPVTGINLSGPLDARLLIPLLLRRRASTVRSPIRARGASDTTKGKMRMVLALAVLAASLSAFAEQSPLTGEPYRLPLLCNKSGEKISGLTKICYYSCAKSEGAMTATTYEACPRWTIRWKLNRNAQFGPKENSR
jgi:hypothetical protein